MFPPLWGIVKQRHAHRIAGKGTETGHAILSGIRAMNGRRRGDAPTPPLKEGRALRERARFRLLFAHAGTLRERRTLAR